MKRGYVAALLALLLLALTAPALAAGVPDKTSDTVQVEENAMTTDQAKGLADALAPLNHARWKVLAVPTMGSNPDTYLDAASAAWKLSPDTILIIVAKNGRLRVEVGTEVGGKYGVNTGFINSAAGTAWAPKASSGDIAGGAAAVAAALDAQLASNGAPALTPAPNAQKQADGSGFHWPKLSLPQIDLSAHTLWGLATLVLSISTVVALVSAMRHTGRWRQSRRRPRPQSYGG